MNVPPIILCPYDAELYGHWWFEGPVFLEWVFRYMKDSDFKSTTPSRYLDKLIDLGLVHKQKIGKENFYINKDLYAFLHDAPQIHHL